MKLRLTPAFRLYALANVLSLAYTGASGYLTSEEDVREAGAETGYGNIKVEGYGFPKAGRKFSAEDPSGKKVTGRVDGLTPFKRYRMTVNSGWFNF